MYEDTPTEVLDPGQIEALRLEGEQLARRQHEEAAAEWRRRVERIAAYDLGGES